MDLQITKTLVIPSNEIKWRFSRSSGPGGQNVNKIESRVEIIFNLEDSKVLNDYQKAILKINLKNKLVKNFLCLAHIYFSFELGIYFFLLIAFFGILLNFGEYMFDFNRVNSL